MYLSYIKKAILPLLILGLFLGCSEPLNKSKEQSVTGFRIAAPKTNHLPNIIGLEEQLTAEVIYFDKSSEVVHEDVNWSSSNSDVAVVDESGVVTVIGLGTTDINASILLNNKTYFSRIELNVLNVVLQSIEVATLPINIQSIAAGRNVYYRAKGHFENNITLPVGHLLQWTSSNNTVAELNTSILITAQTKVPGEVVITATYTKTGVSATKELKVTDAVVKSIKIDALTQSLYVGDKITFTTTATYTDTREEPDFTGVKWSSSNTDLLKFSGTFANNNPAEAKSAGVVKVTAKLDEIITFVKDDYEVTIKAK